MLNRYAEEEVAPAGGGGFGGGDVRRAPRLTLEEPANMSLWRGC